MTSTVLISALLLSLGAPPRPPATADDTTTAWYQLGQDIAAIRAELLQLRLLIDARCPSPSGAATPLNTLPAAKPTMTTPAPPTSPGEPNPPPPPNESSGPVVAPSLPPLPDEPAEAPRTRLRGTVQLPGVPDAPIWVYVGDILARPVRRASARMAQSRMEFVPSALVIQRGTKVEFPNLDVVYHNVFSFSKPNHFDLGLYRAQDRYNTHVFAEPGLVRVYCHIHPEMTATILVTPNAFVTAAVDGAYELEGVPRGPRTIMAWSPHGGWAEVKVNLSRPEQRLNLTLRRADPDAIRPPN